MTAAVRRRTDAAAADVLPTLVGAAVGAVALTRLVLASAPRARGQAGAAVVPEAQPLAPRTEPPAELLQTDRRRFLLVSSAVVGTAAVTALAGRRLADRFSVASAHAAVRLPRAAHPAPALPPGSDLPYPWPSLVRHPQPFLPWTRRCLFLG